MSSYTLTAVATVAVVVAGAEVSRLDHQRQNKDHPAWKQWDIKPAIHPVIGGFTLGLFLFAAGMASEHLATLLCLLIVVSSLLINGPALFALLNPSPAPKK